MLKTSIVLLLLLALIATCLRQPDIPSEDLNTLVIFFKQANEVAKIAVKDYAEKKDMSNRRITMKEDQSTNFQESVHGSEIKKERRKDVKMLLRKGEGRAKLTSADFVDERTMIPNVMSPDSTVPISVRNSPSDSFSLSINYHGLSSDPVSSDPVSLELKSMLLKPCSWKMDEITHEWKFSPPLTNFQELIAVVPEDVKKDSVLPLPSVQEIINDIWDDTDLQPLDTLFNDADALARSAMKDAEKKEGNIKHPDGSIHIFYGPLLSLELKSKLLKKPCSWKMDEKTRKWERSSPLTNFLELAVRVRGNVLPLPRVSDIMKDIEQMASPSEDKD